MIFEAVGLFHRADPVRAAAGIDLAPVYSSGSLAGTVGHSMPITIATYNYGDTPTPDDTIIYVELWVNGVKKATQPYLPVRPPAYSFGADGQNLSYRGMTFYWTPDTEGTHALQFIVSDGNYTDTNPSNNTLNLNATVAAPRKNLYTQTETGNDLAVRYSSGSTSGTVGSSMAITVATYNYGDAQTPNGQNISVELYVDGVKTTTQQYTPQGMTAYCFGAYGQAYYYNGMTFNWTPTKDGVHLLQFKVVHDNYTDANPSNNFLIVPVDINEPSNAVNDVVDFGNSGSESSHSVSSSAGGTGSYSETIGTLSDTFDSRYSGGVDSWFSADVANPAGKYGTLAIREQHLAVSSTFRDVVNNPDQSGTGTTMIPIDVDGPQGQTFRTGLYTTYIPSFAVQVEKVGLLNSIHSAGNHLTLSLYESPHKNKLLGQVKRKPIDVEGGYNWIVFDFEEDVAVLPDTTYYFELTTDLAFDNLNKYVLSGWNSSAYADGAWYDNGVVQTGKTLSFRTGPDIPTTYDVQINGTQAGGYDQLSTGTTWAAADVNNGGKVGQVFTVGNVTELQAIAVALAKTGTIPENNAVKLTLYDTVVSSTTDYLAADPWDTPVVADAVLKPSTVPGSYQLATFVFPQKAVVYPGRRYYFELSTVLPFDTNNKYTVKAFDSSGYASSGDLYVNRVKQASGKAVEFKTGGNPTFNTRSLYDKGNGALTYYVDFPTTYGGSSIAVKFVNKNPDPIHIDKLWNYTGFNSYASQYDVPLRFTPVLGKPKSDHTLDYLDMQTDVVISNIVGNTGGYLGGNAALPGFSVEDWYAKWKDVDPTLETAAILAIAKDKGLAVNMNLSSAWGGTPPEFYATRYEQLMYSTTDSYSDPDMDTLSQELDYANDKRFGLTAPNIWGSLPWLTFNNGGFVNPAPDTLNGYKIDKMSTAIEQINKDLFDLARQTNGAELLSVSGDAEPAYWGYQMRDGDHDPYRGFPTLNSGSLRYWPTGDFGPDAVAQAALDSVTLDPTDGLDNAEKNWLHSNMTDYNDFMYGNLQSKLLKGITKVDNNVITYPTDRMKGNVFTSNYIYLRYSISRDRPLYEPGVLDKMKPGYEAVLYTSDIPIIERLIGNAGRTANVNMEAGGTAVGYDTKSAVAFMQGLRFFTLYNSIQPWPYYEFFYDLYDKFNEFAGDPIRIATLVDKRRKSLTTAAERDAYLLQREVAPKVQPGDTPAVTYLNDGDTAYDNGDFHTAYQKYVAAESASKTDFPSPFSVSGTEGTLTPFPLKVTAVSGGHANIVVNAYTATPSAEIAFDSTSTASGTVGYALTAPFGGSHDVYVNGTLHSSSFDGTKIVFTVSQTSNVKYTVVVSTSAPTPSPTPTPTPTPTPLPGTNLAVKKTVTSSSSIEGNDWYQAYAVDGWRNTWKGSHGWSSNSNLTANHTEWIKVDLGAVYGDVSRVDLYPRDNDFSNMGYGFPLDFTIQVSGDDVNWTTVETVTDYARPLGVAQRFLFAPVNARYVKITGTELRPNPNENNEYRMQFAEIEVITAPAPSYSTVPHYKMTATATSYHAGYEPGKALDGTGAAFWHSEWSPMANLPQSITLDLGGSYTVNKLRYLPRQDTGLNSDNGIITSYNVYVSTDGVNFTKTATGSWSGDKSEKSAAFVPVAASYVRLEAVAGVGGFATAGEINIESANSVIVDDADPGIVYNGAWTVGDGYPSAYDGTHSYSKVANDYAEYTFNGTAVKWYVEKDVNRGYADVYIDGVLDAANVDTYSPATQDQRLVYQKTGLSSGSHTIKIVVKGAKNPSSSDTYVGVDALEYY